MVLSVYRRVLERPGVTSLVATMIVARIPLAATGLVLTLHVTGNRPDGGLALGYAAAGAAAAVMAVGGAIGAPFVGRGMDRLGLRPVLAVTTSVSATFWCAAPALPYPALLPAAFVAGVFGMPVFSLLRQSLAAILPDAQRQAGFSIDTISAEVSFSVGPVVAVVLMTRVGSTAGMVVLAATIVVAGTVLWIMDPPIRRGEGDAPAPARSQHRVGTRTWLDARVGAILLATAGGTMLFSGTDVTITASMRSFDAVGSIGVVIAVWGLGSVVGGFVYGGLTRRWDPVVLLAILGALVIPVTLATNWIAVAVLMIPAALCCGPLVTASADQLVSSTPAAVRGEVIGSHSSALTFGNAVGTPIAGLIIDATSPRIGFAGMGGVALALAVTGLGARMARRRHAAAAVVD